MFSCVNGAETFDAAKEPPAGFPTVVPIEEVGKPSRPWKLMLYPAHLALEPAPDIPPYLILREHMMKSATVIEGMRVLAVSKPIKASFKLTPATAALLTDWIGKPALAACYLRRRYAWVLPVAVIWVFGSLPMKGDPDAGTDSIPFDPFGLVLGLILVASWAWAKWRPHPTLFLVDSTWFLLMGGYLLKDVAGGRNKAWLALVVLLLWMAVTGVKHFVRFRGTPMARTA